MEFKEIISAVAPKMKDVAISYIKKDKNTDNLTWLSSNLINFLPESARKELSPQAGQEILSTIGNFSENLASIKQAATERKTKSAWLKNFIEKNDSISAEQKSNYIKALNMIFPMDKESKRIDSEILENQIDLTNVNIFSSDTDINDPAELFPQEVLAEAEKNSILDEGLKIVAATALKASIAAGKIPFLPKALPLNIITNFACVGVETAKNLHKVAKGKFSAGAAFENIGRATVAAVADCVASDLPAKILALLPVGGPIMSYAAGNLISSMAGKNSQELFKKGFEIVKEYAKEVAPILIKKVSEKIPEYVEKIADRIPVIGKKLWQYKFKDIILTTV